jgi:metallophosphoesterase superfamily enzyme
MKPAPAGGDHPLGDGIIALPPGFALLTQSRALLVADAHFGYEDVMGGGAALPLWSTAEMAATIAIAAQRHAVREIVFLGDAIHGAGLSAGAIRTVVAAFDSLRGLADVTFVAGNHEGRSRGSAILGSTVEACVRDGWLLAHGDKPGRRLERSVIGHLHPSLQLGGGASIPAFIAGERIVVVPALTPYSSGLDVLSDACIAALEPWAVRRADVQIVAATSDRVFPFGTLAALRGALRVPAPRPSAPRGFVRRRRLDPG